MKSYPKKDFPVEEVRWFLEPGPIVLVSSAARGERNIMTLGWHMILGFAPSLVGCYIWNANHSFGLARRNGTNTRKNNNKLCPTDRKPAVKGAASL